jgi:hypothetical protein
VVDRYPTSDHSSFGVVYAPLIISNRPDVRLSSLGPVFILLSVFCALSVPKQRYSSAPLRLADIFFPPERDAIQSKYKFVHAINVFVFNLMRF